MGLKHRHDYESISRELLASEHNYIQPQFAGKINLAIVYPNLYSLGMSNLGFLTVHRIACSIPGFGVERFFPALEAERPLRPPYYSFETHRPLADFDLLLFSFSYEGDFDKIPGLFSALGLPIKSEKRNRHHPLLIAGGAAVAANPAALSRIFDVIVPGEAETTLQPMLEKFRDEGIGLETVADIAGIWVPALKDFPNPIEKKCDIDLTPAWAHLVSSRNAFGGAHIIEIMRGCPRNCAFCLARVIYHPVRRLSFANFCSWLDRFPQCRDLGLVAPSLFDHPEIELIFAELARRGIRIRNSSVKWEKLGPQILDLLRDSNIKSLTLAPETGSEKLRTAMKKPMNEDSFFACLESIKKAGFEHVKLYFIAGLPDEEQSDLESTIEFLGRAQRHLGKTALSATFSIFVPKKGTAWESEKFLSQAEIKHKIRYIKELLQKLPEPVKVNFESPQEASRQMFLSQAGPELADEYTREAEKCSENRLFARNQFSALEF
jgi:radical SAM superfamily enzyme YgiQ (UPF0313 family)